MIFLPEAVLDTKNKLFDDARLGKADCERTYRRILELDPNDHLALGMLAQLRWDAGDHAGAEELAWRAANAQPCAWAPFMQLSMFLHEQEPLSKGLTELAIRKLLRDEEKLEEMASNPSAYEWKNGPETEGASTVEKYESLVAWLHQQRDLEPLDVTARLRPYRLIHQLQDGESLDRGLVDTLVREGSSIVLLLIGVLRAWVQYVIPEDDECVAENTLALLGEIGDAGALHDLLAMSGLEEPAMTGAAQWAVDRIFEQHPEEAARVAREIAPELSSGERMGVARSLLRFPKTDPNGNIFERLFEKLDRLDKDGRDYCFRSILPLVVIMRGRAGADSARSLLRRHGSLLSRDARRDCEDMIEQFNAMPLAAPGPNPSTWTVYDICNGDVDWEAELEPEEDDEFDDEEYIPEPVRKKAAPGRNDPCWCGSGKKYKKCHLEADERADREPAKPPASAPPEPEGEFDSLRSEIAQVMRKLPRSEHHDAIMEFFGTDRPDNPKATALLGDWMVHDRISEAFGITVMEEYLRRNASKLSERERNFVESSISSCFNLYEVLAVKEGAGVEVKSLTTPGTFFVHDINLSKVCSPWDGLLARMLDAERGHEFSGVGIGVPRSVLETMCSWLKEDRRRTGLAWPAYLKRNWPRIHAQNEEIIRQYNESMTLANSDGEELVISEARYRVVNLGALIAALRSCMEIDESEEGTSFVWLSGPAAGTGHTVLGKIRVVGGEMTVECNSKPRLKRAKKLLAGLAGSALDFRKDEFTSQKDLRQSIKENPPPPPSHRDIPPEVEAQIIGQALESHYARWPDMKLGALDGKTPRQAVKNAAGKRKVAELLKQLENSEHRKRKAGEYAYDVSKLRAELGIKS
jgi:hypothetical protein